MKTEDFISQWMNEQQLVLQRSTYEALTVYVYRHILPYIVKKCPELSQITASVLQAYVMDKLRDGRVDGKGGLSLVSVRKHFSVIKQILNEAVRLGYLSANPAFSVKIPRNREVHERMVFLTAQEAQKMLDALKNTKIYLAVVLALYYGLRRSEVLGLRWSAIDFKRDTVTICHTVVKGLTVEAKDTTKTSSSRRVFQLLPEVKQLLLLFRGDRTDDDYLFVGDNGEVMRPDCLTKMFQRGLKRAGLPSMRFHDLRHTTASVLFDNGWSLEDVKNWLGHADIETTSNIYLHYGKVRKILLADELSGMFRI